MDGNPMSDSATARIRQDALEVLRALLRLELSAARWEGVGAILDALDAGLELGDIEMVTGATIRLGEVGPVRVTRIGGTSGEPPPPPVRERVNELISKLSGAAKDEDEA
jgi:hypothetical protein